jgi:integrase
MAVRDRAVACTGAVDTITLSIVLWEEALTRAGIDATDYSGHSPRAGLVTAAAMAGVSERIIMLQTGHKNIVVLRRYIREGSVFRENAAAAVGL